jgi:LPS-assembly protein
LNVFIISRPFSDNHQSGLLIPRLGQSSRHGWEIFVPVYWAINASMDATIALEGMTKRGVKPSVEFRYRPSRKTEGEWDLTAFLIDVVGFRRNIRIMADQHQGLSSLR